MTRQLHTLVCIGGITCISLTFFHPAMWAPVGLALGVALLLLASPIILETQVERAGYYAALIWVTMTALVAMAYGFSEQLFNVKQVILMLGGLLFGYFLSLRPAPFWAAWTPFCLFALYFLLFLVLGREPGEVFPRNSQNYVSVILLALFASAVILTRPTTVRMSHIAIAGVVVLLSIWAAGRGGILSSLLLTGALIFRFVTQGRKGISRWMITAFVVLIASIAVFLIADILKTQGFLYKFEGRGLRDPSRLTILMAYFENIEISELMLGKNYYQDNVIGRWGFNLHNSYLDAWAHLGIFYLVFILTVFFISFRRRRIYPVIAIAVLAFAARALTDSQMFSGQYDYLVFATLFMFLRVPDGQPIRIEK